MPPRTVAIPAHQAPVRYASVRRCRSLLHPEHARRATPRRSPSGTARRSAGSAAGDDARRVSTPGRCSVRTAGCSRRAQGDAGTCAAHSSADRPQRIWRRWRAGLLSTPAREPVPDAYRHPRKSCDRSALRRRAVHRRSNACTSAPDTACTPPLLNRHGADRCEP